MKTFLKKIREKLHRDIIVNSPPFPPGLEVIENANKEQRICAAPFSFCEIQAEGLVFPCCPVWTNYYAFGNIYESDFVSVWNSEKAKEFRKSVWEGNYKFCNREKCLPNYKNRNEFFDNYNDDGTYTKYPPAIKLAYDGSCNVYCIMCRDKKIFASKEETDKLDTAVYSALKPILEKIESVELNGAGEVFASSHCRNLVKKIAGSYPHIKFALHTNGIMCDERNCMELGIIDKITHVQISLHAASKATYDKIVRGGNYEKVLENIKWLSSLKKQGKIKQLNLYFVVSSFNYFEMKQFMEMAIALDAMAIFWNYQPWGASLDAEYNKYAVFCPEHPEYKNMAGMLEDDIFKSKYCEMNEIIRNVKMENVI
jgi:radical SAM protein with 4Fe4S-binding SPASM domain